MRTVPLAVAALLVLLVAAAVPGCTVVPGSIDASGPADSVVSSMVPNLTYTINSTHMTMTYVPDGTESRVAIAPVWDGHEGYGEVGIAAEFADRSRPAVYVEPRSGRRPAHRLILIARPGGTVEYREPNPELK